MKDKLYLQERLNQILGLVEEQERVSVADLSQRFGVSAVTIRNDLALLEEQGQLVRTHGGAMARPGAALVPAFALRKGINAQEKVRIGRMAAALVQDGDTIALDDSTASWYIAQHLKNHHELTVVTNGLLVALEFLDAPGVSVAIPGGVLRPVSASLVGEWGLLVLEHYQVQKGFFSARGFTLEEGLSDPDLYSADFKRQMVQRCREVVAVVDSSKWNRVAFTTYATVNQIERVITDAAAPQAMLDALRRRGVDVQVTSDGR